MSGRILAVVCAAAGAALLAASIPAANEPITLGAKLRARSEVPRPKGITRKPGGRFSVKYFPATHKLAWKLTFWDLTGKATAAHIHAGAAGKAGPVLIPLCGPCASGAKGTVKLTSAQISPKRPWYVNVHTDQNAGGEIRGQIKLTGPPIVKSGPSGSTSLCCPPG